MYSPFQISLKFLAYYLKASNSKGHGMHSPFVFDFITKVLNDKQQYPAYAIVEQLRQSLHHDDTLLSVEDFGAGSNNGRLSQRSVSSIARRAAKPRKYGQLLFRMVKHYQPKTILELGTSLGITTSYLSLAGNKAKLVTLEGAEAVAQKADQNLNAFSKKDIAIADVSLVRGNFDETLPSAIAQLNQVDFVFIDGNHRREPTERYFNQLLSATHNDSILIFDDIHWSREMEDAWAAIQAHPAVRCTIDLFFIGIVLLREEFREKQHFKVRF